PASSVPSPRQAAGCRTFPRSSPTRSTSRRRRAELWHPSRSRRPGSCRISRCCPLAQPCAGNLFRDRGVFDLLRSRLEKLAFTRPLKDQLFIADFLFLRPVRSITRSAILLRGSVCLHLPDQALS